LAALKAAVVGVGEMGRNHARIYNELEDAELCCVCDADPERAGLISRLYKVPNYSDFGEMLSKVDLDVVSVAVPSAHHVETASLAVEKGINVLVEKPIDLSLERARSLVKQAHDAGVSLMVGHIERFNPAIVKLKEMIGELGTPTIALATRAGPLPNRIKDVGAIIDLGVHDLDLLRHILGSEVERLYCECGRIIHKDQTDYGKMLLRFRNGVVASVDVNWLTPVKVRRLVIQGLNAMFEVDYIRQELFKYNVTYTREFTDWSDILLGMTEGEMVRIPVKMKEPLKNELEEFVRSIREGEPPPVTGEDAIKSLELALLAEESGHKHQVLEL
jgi:predicted dehydrogenase